MGPGSRVGRLERLTRCWVLALPAGCPAGRVVAVAGPQRRLPVGFLEPLFEIEPLAAATASSPTSAAAGKAGLPAGAEDHVILRAPSDGVYYGRPTPEAPPFVEPGSRVRQGQPVGLIEVMKTFQQVLYGGEGLPEKAEVVAVAARDGQEVQAGEPLLILRPLG